VLPVLGVRRSSGGATGTFHCPGCGGDRTYRRRSSRGRFPVVPAGSAEPLVECRTCRGRFSPGVLDVPTSARLEELLWRGSRTAAAYVLTGLLADAAPRSTDDVRLALGVLRRVLGPDYGPEVLAPDLAAHREGTDLEVLEQLAPHLSVHGAEGLLRGLADLVLLLDGAAGPDWRRLGHVAVALGVTPTHLRGIVDEAWARARE
jgi:hypothetical protein